MPSPVGIFKRRLAASAFRNCSDKRTTSFSSSTQACCSLTESLFDLFFNLGGHSGTEAKLREFHYLLHLVVSRPKAQIKFSLYCFGASEATIFSKRGSPRKGSQAKNSF